MRLTRREFTTLTALSAAGAAAAPTAFARYLMDEEDIPHILTWRPLRPGAVDAYVASEYGGNALLVISTSQAALIDSKNAGFGDALRREAESFNAKITALINTHHHADHTGGNYAFAEDVPIIAHSKAAPRVRGQVERYTGSIRNVAQQALANEDAPAALKADLNTLVEKLADLDADSFAPTQTVGDEHELHAGQRAIELRHVGNGHTDNDVFIYLPQLNAIHAGDLLFHELHPFIDVSSHATTAGWQRSLDAMIALCDNETVVVPGHGELTNRAGLTKQRSYFDILRTHVRKAIANDMSREDVMNMTIPEVADHGFAQLQPRNLGTVYDELQAE